MAHSKRKNVTRKHIKNRERLKRLKKAAIQASKG